MMTTSFIMLGITGVWSFLVYLVFGLICAGIAKAIMPGKDPGGFWVTALIGIVGAYLGAYMRTILGISHDGEVSFFSPLDWIFSILGALILLFIWKKLLAPMFNK
ncbi:MAG: GlsB/YeaQ/YmgE family stress response membrane protein [Empedobacter falsenii]|uniref:Membrane protein n=2 Tax=Empedobacter brevis TaxID=247 RepID=A0A511NHU2_9FLAO|nr:GlsB/YeaQ/YmgE family stress response membrane protein [Empedobacter brevis]GEM52334.1 membrane protein [Empedobacter brevis NBRC 14943 = ATCC 43319]